MRAIASSSCTPLRLFRTKPLDEEATHLKPACHKFWGWELKYFETLVCSGEASLGIRTCHVAAVVEAAEGMKQGRHLKRHAPGPEEFSTTGQGLLRHTASYCVSSNDLFWKAVGETRLYASCEGNVQQQLALKLKITTKTNRKKEQCVRHCSILFSKIARVFFQWRHCRLRTSSRCRSLKALKKEEEKEGNEGVPKETILHFATLQTWTEKSWSS